jgi:hypothetical protein
VSANAREKLDVTATMKPTVTEDTRVAQKTGGKIRRPIGRRKILIRDSLEKVPLNNARLCRYVLRVGTAGSEVSATFSVRVVLFLDSSTSWIVVPEEKM